jgi:hypothetical protein
MRKVLVDREDIEAVRNTLANGGQAVSVLRWAENILAQPAEAEWVVFGFDDRSVKVSQEAYSIFLARERHYLDALSAVTAERDRLQRNLNFTEQWYAERFERLADLGKSAGCWDAMAAIIANGTADPYEPPTYAQQLVRANHRADVAERERDQLRAEVERLRAGGNRTAARETMRRILPDVPGDLLDHALFAAHSAAMAAKEA